ncbi:hypothetical protein P153DRAFT_136794 [Dothidotthia symphoricarpi CBS 119687]|uniref:Uncharacterized protein n=1 Tax=Dothidotthia symphoricarpi CBS 119687 TaxID=1392245 RepID=A0A6A5ZZ66_9PLEO|nr:uncharacterized protein P153DRAFT_136794 [Dothidotthia symphoricarpi CBS 119687]KAF2124184.1 hypothetical protein P153DRAFT_136794 [Dothidotthia symphoricarpi CBS 119687]
MRFRGPSDLVIEQARFDSPLSVAHIVTQSINRYSPLQTDTQVPSRHTRSPSLWCGCAPEPWPLGHVCQCRDIGSPKRDWACAPGCRHVKGCSTTQGAHVTISWRWSGLCSWLVGSGTAGLPGPVIKRLGWMPLVTVRPALLEARKITAGLS